MRVLRAAPGDAQAAGDGAADRLGCAPDEISLTTSRARGSRPWWPAWAAATRSSPPTRSIRASTGRWPRRGSAAPRSSSRPSTTSPMPWTSRPPPSSARTSAGSAVHRARRARVGGRPGRIRRAQGVGAVPVDVKMLDAPPMRARARATCGPDGRDALRRARVSRARAVLIPSYVTVSEPAAGLDATRWPDSRAWDTPALAGETSRFALASLDVLADAGWDAVHTCAVELAAQSGRGAGGTGPNGASSRRHDPGRMGLRAGGDGERARPRRRRPDPAPPVGDLLRASVGAWNDDSDLERLLCLARRSRAVASRRL